MPFTSSSYGNISPLCAFHGPTLTFSNHNVTIRQLKVDVYMSFPISSRFPYKSFYAGYLPGLITYPASKCKSPPHQNQAPEERRYQLHLKKPKTKETEVTRRSQPTRRSEGSVLLGVRQHSSVNSQRYLLFFSSLPPGKSGPPK
jgi:hypothetical protein